MSGFEQKRPFTLKELNSFNKLKMAGINRFTKAGNHLDSERLKNFLLTLS